MAANNERNMCRPVSELPPKYRSVFPYVSLNRVQSLVFETMLESSVPVVVSAPTGSGKTGVFELAIVKILMDREQNRLDTGAKIVYLAPTKALCAERRTDWEKKFSHYGIQCLELTSDNLTPINFKDLKKTSILLATPEKWDSVTRSWSGQKVFVQSIRLLLVDEVHLVNDGERGATLEAVISRMKTIRSLVWQYEPENLRFVAVSATVSNIQDIADWFTTTNSKAKVFRVDPKERPVKLRTIVLGYTAKQNCNEFQFDSSLNHKLAEVVREHSNEKPTLIFCATRKSAANAAMTLARDGKFDLSFASDKRQIYTNLASNMRDKTLQETVRFGIAFHHAGLTPTDRRLLERAFLDGNLMVLCCTSTLALGVNLPAHLVIIKNTVFYDEGQFKPYTESSIVQMIGRAGRPQFDTEATAVIMTKSYSRTSIEQMLTGKLIVESQLHKYLTEHMNSEIVLGTVTSDAIARKWIDSTYLHVRLLKSPENYGLTKTSSMAIKEARVASWCNESITKLIQHKMIRRNKDNGLEPTDAGQAMAKHYISLDTMINITTLKGTETLWELMLLVCRCQEVAGEIQYRNEDKSTINALINQNDDTLQLRFPVSDKVVSKEKKAAILIEATFGNLTIPENTLLQESLRIIRNATRIVDCLREVSFRNEKINYRILNNILILGQCFAAKLWENSPYVSKQLDRIGPVLSQNLASNGLTTFEALRKSNPRNIEIFCSRLPPFGSNVQQTCFGLPVYSMQIQFRSIPGITTKIQLLVELSIANGQDLRVQKSLPVDHKCTLIVGSLEDDKVLLRRVVSDAVILNRPDMTCCYGSEFDRIEMPKGGSEIEAQLISEAYVGIDIKVITRYVEPEIDI